MSCFMLGFGVSCATGGVLNYGVAEEPLVDEQTVWLGPSRFLRKSDSKWFFGGEGFKRGADHEDSYFHWWRNKKHDAHSQWLAMCGTRGFAYHRVWEDPRLSLVKLGDEIPGRSSVVVVPLPLPSNCKVWHVRCSRYHPNEVVVTAYLPSECQVVILVIDMQKTWATKDLVLVSKTISVFPTGRYDHGITDAELMQTRTGPRVLIFLATSEVRSPCQAPDHRGIFAVTEGHSLSQGPINLLTPGNSFGRVTESQFSVLHSAPALCEIWDCNGAIRCVNMFPFSWAYSCISDICWVCEGFIFIVMKQQLSVIDALTGFTVLNAKIPSHICLIERSLFETITSTMW
ncbi:hypothetical protein Pelo_8577 [Pelomyxa schiedti]|nr:hypothetical protein Pelo_8577 [Pelomyxa schiedti]